MLENRFYLFNVEKYELNILFVLIRYIDLLFKQFKKSLKKFDSNYTRKALYISLKNDIVEVLTVRKSFLSFQCREILIKYLICACYMHSLAD